MESDPSDESVPAQDYCQVLNKGVPVYRNRRQAAHKEGDTLWIQGACGVRHMNGTADSVLI